MSKQASDSPESWPAVYRRSSFIGTTIQKRFGKSFYFLEKRELCVATPSLVSITKRSSFLCWPREGMKHIFEGLLGMVRAADC